MKEGVPKQDKVEKTSIPDNILAALRESQKDTEVGTRVQEQVLEQLRGLSDEELAAEISKAGTEWWTMAGSYQQPYGRGVPLTTGQVFKDMITDAKRFYNRTRLRDLSDYKIHLHQVEGERRWAKESAQKTETWEQRFAEAEARGATIGPALKEAVLNFFVRDRMRHATYKGDQFLRNEAALQELAAAFPDKNISVLLAEWTRYKNPHHKVEGDQYDVYDADSQVHYGLLELFGVKGYE